MADETDTKNASFTQGASQSTCIELFRQAGDGAAVSEGLEVTINFHPDRMTLSGVPLLEAINNDGVLKSQFETGTSNGGLTAFPGGGRWAWESRAFKGMYNACAPCARPKYGALNYKGLASGGSPRFGSSYFKLKSELLDRITFCYPESFFGPKGYGAGRWVSHLIEMANADDKDPLDNYIEAHVHGEIEIEHDVEVLVLDPSYKGTEVEALANALPCELIWHSGFKMMANLMERYPDYRGDEIVGIGQEIAEEGWLTPQIIGLAVNEGVFDSQKLKKVWHYLARFGDRNL